MTESKVIAFEDRDKRRIEELRKTFVDFNTRHIFQPGDIVQWKKDCCHMSAGGLFIVMEVLQTPVFDYEGHWTSGSTYFREPLDIILGYRKNEDERFVCFHCDSRRFEPYKK